MDQDLALLRTFSGYPDDSSPGIEVVDVEGAQLGYPEAGGVQEFQHRIVPTVPRSSTVAIPCGRVMALLASVD
jgi:hypothetical protein